MTKSVLAIAAAIFALAMFGSTAEAGFKVRLGFGFGGPVPFHGHQYSNDYQPRTYQKRASRKVQRPAAQKVETAKAQPAEKIETAALTDADTENSSITTVAATTQTAEVVSSETVETAAVAAPKELGCKKFFASVGMVLSVPCE